MKYWNEREHGIGHESADTNHDGGSKDPGYKSSYVFALIALLDLFKQILALFLDLILNFLLNGIIVSVFRLKIRNFPTDLTLAFFVRPL